MPWRRHGHHTAHGSREPHGAAVSPGQVNLSWGASTDDVGVAGYKVYRDGAFLASATGTSYSDTTVQGGTSHTYTVYAYDAAGNISPASNTATVTTPTDTQPPTTPTGLAGTVEEREPINLTWNAATDNVGVAGYTVYRNGTAIATTSGANATSYSDTSVASGTTYTYTVDAFDGTGNHSPPSDPVSVTTPSGTVHTVTLTPVADSYADSSNTTATHGTSAQLRVDGSPLVYAYQRYDLSSVPGTITGLSLKVFATSSSSAGYAGAQRRRQHLERVRAGLGQRTPDRRHECGDLGGDHQQCVDHGRCIFPDQRQWPAQHGDDRHQQHGDRVFEP